MSEHIQDRRVEHVKERLLQELVDEEGRRPDPERVAQAVESAAEPLADAAVQEFTPLLIEHDARDALRDDGFRRQLPDRDDA
jgi:hypothetical protein